MNLLPIKLRALFRKYSGELKISIISLSLSIFASFIFNLLIRYRDPYLILFFGFGTLFILLIIGILFNQKRLVEAKFKTVSKILSDQFCYSTEDNQFFKRREHYTSEKELLAKVLVRDVFKKIISNIKTNNPNVRNLRIIIDSGTTLTPIFPKLLEYGIPYKEELKIKIFTNSMSGIDEIHKIGKSPDFLIDERDFNIIGGQPLNKYRATTGDFTQKFLNTLIKEKNDNQDEIIYLSILTANWFLMQSGLDKVSICARGAGHFSFKRTVYSLSDYVILVSPLGKLLRLNDVNELNKIIKRYEDDTYKSFFLDDEKKDKIYLLTTYREPDSKSPFIGMSIQLKNIENNKLAKNYTLLPESPEFKPPGETKEDIFLYETPHRYIRENVKKAFSIPDK